MRPCPGSSSHYAGDRVARNLTVKLRQVTKILERFGIAFTHNLCIIVPVKYEHQLPGIPVRRRIIFCCRMIIIHQIANFLNIPLQFFIVCSVGIFVHNTLRSCHCSLNCLALGRVHCCGPLLIRLGICFGHLHVYGDVVTQADFPPICVIFGSTTKTAVISPASRLVIPVQLIWTIGHQRSHHFFKIKCISNKFIKLSQSIFICRLAAKSKVVSSISGLYSKGCKGNAETCTSIAALSCFLDLCLELFV